MTHISGNLVNSVQFIQAGYFYYYYRDSEDKISNVVNQHWVSGGTDLEIIK